MSNNVLITGGAGYVGGAVVDILEAEGLNEYIVYDNLLYEERFLKNVPFVKGDVRDHDSLQEWLEWADTVVWLAALVGDGACAVNPHDSLAINHDAVVHMTQNFKGRIIFPSTCSVYGQNKLELTEEDPVRPLSVYAATKYAAENVIKANCEDYIIFRLGTLYGKGDEHSRVRLDLVVNAMTRSAWVNKQITVFGGDQFRPLIHVRDAAQAMCDQIGRTDTGTYNLSRENLEIKDLATIIAGCFDEPIEICTQDMPFEDQRDYVVSIEKLNTLGFVPKWGVADGAKELLDLLQGERINDHNSPRYSNHAFLENHERI